MVEPVLRAGDHPCGRVWSAGVEFGGAPESGDGHLAGVGFDLGEVAHESAEAAGFGGCGEDDQVAAGAVGAEHLRGELGGGGRVVDALFVGVDVAGEAVDAGLDRGEQPRRVGVGDGAVEVGQGGLDLAERGGDGFDGGEVELAVDESQRLRVDLAEGVGQAGRAVAGGGGEVGDGVGVLGDDGDDAGWDAPMVVRVRCSLG